MYDSDSLSDSDDDISALDFSSMPKRQSRRQRGLAPEFSDASNDLYDSLVWLKTNSFQPVAVCVSEKTNQRHNAKHTQSRVFLFPQNTIR